VGEKLYDVVAIRVYDAEKTQIGVLAFGAEIGDAVADELRKLTQSQIALLAGGRVIASTLTGPDAKEQFAEMFRGSLLAGDSANAAAKVKPVVLNGLNYYGIAGRFESLKGDNTLGYVLLNSYEDSRRDLQKTQQVLFIVSLCAILAGAAAVWFLINKATKPLRELRDSAEAVGRGDFTRRVVVRGNDECGELAKVFNQMTENLQGSRAQLEQTVETLKTTQAQLVQSEKLSAVGEFVAGVAHELNNPLAAVIGFSELLKNTDADSKNRRYLDMIYKSAHRCQKIVQSLLSFARRHKPERKPVCVNGLIEAVLEIVNYQLRTSNIEVSMQLDPTLPVVLADEHQIQQVLLNVINNARQAIEDHQPHGAVKIVTEATDQSVHIIIHDNGPGISEENLRRIFDPFFTTKEVGKGTGLGLSLCYGIIKEHGGTITPSSRPGGGATFIIELPVLHMNGDTTKILRSTEINGANPHEGAGKKILVIDDETAILEMLREELTGHGYDVDVAADGETALTQLNENRYDVTFCDWKMPGLNGRQVYENLRARKPDLCRRFVFITGDVVNEQMRGFLEQEKRPYLAKPFTFGEVRDAIKSALAA
jgi:two-component system NtrC family sensor kinase